MSMMGKAMPQAGGELVYEYDPVSWPQDVGAVDYAGFAFRSVDDR